MLNTSGKPLVVFAGFKPAEIVELQMMLAKAGLDKKYAILPLPFGPGQTAYTIGYLNNLITTTCERIIKSNTKKRDNEYASPSNILLVYVEADDLSCLLNNTYRFFRSHKILRDPSGSIGLGKIVFLLQDKDFTDVKFIARKDNKLLPLRNFYLAKKQTIDSKWLMGEVVNFDKKSIPLSKMRNCPKKYVYKDYRGICFDLAPECHGDVSLEESFDMIKGKNFLEAKYRFGCPIQNGHHYHLASDNGSLAGVAFFCSRLNAEFICRDSCAYLNIASNDSIRE